MRSDNEEKKLKRKKAETISELCLMSDRLMELVFDSNPVAVALLINVILDREDLMVDEVVVKKEFPNPVTEGRNVEFDIFARDGNDNYYDIEMQIAPTGAISKRARFHSSILDARMLESGQEFKELHDSYVIFITWTDIFGKGCPLYHIKRVVSEIDADFNDGSHIIYVNGSYSDTSTKIGRLIHDLKATSPEGMYFPALKKEIEYYKNSEEGKKMIDDPLNKLALEYGKVLAEEWVNKIVQEPTLERAKERLNELVNEKATELGIDMQ